MTNRTFFENEARVEQIIKILGEGKLTIENANELKREAEGLLNENRATLKTPNKKVMLVCSWDRDVVEEEIEI